MKIIIPLLVVLTVTALLVGIALWIAPMANMYDAERHERWVTGCMKAYDYSRDRCEFIRLNGGRDLQ